MLLMTIVYFHSYTSHISTHTERDRVLRTVVIAKRLDNEYSRIETKGDNNDHDDQNNNVGHRLLIPNARRIDKVGYCAVRRCGCRNEP